MPIWIRKPKKPTLDRALEGRQLTPEDFDALVAEPTETLLQSMDILLRRRGRAYYSTLRRGLSDREINAFEAQLGVTLPEDYKCLLRWKDGSRAMHAPYWAGEFCGRQEVIRTGTMLMEVTRDPNFGIDPTPPFDDINNWWNPAWIPLICEYLGSDVLCLDTVGSFGGKPGQIIEFIHDDYYRPIKHESLKRWLVTTFAAWLSMDEIAEISVLQRDPQAAWDRVDREEAIEKAANPGYPIRWP